MFKNLENAFLIKPIVHKLMNIMNKSKNVFAHLHILLTMEKNVFHVISHIIGTMILIHAKLVNSLNIITLKQSNVNIALKKDHF